MEPTKIEFAKAEIEKLGYTITFENERKLQFVFKYKTVSLFPYTGWHTGPTIKDGRGLQNLLNQIK